MYVQCVQCTKKYKLSPGSIPLGGAAITCKGCAQKLFIEPRDRVEGDMTRIPVTKAQHKKEVKWFHRSEEIIKEMGYEKKTAEYNMLFFFLREFRKRFGITFFDLNCNVRVKVIDRELMYNRLSFFGNCCVPPLKDNSFESCIPGILGGIAEVLRAKDSSGRFSVANSLRVAYPDSFPSLVRFVFGASFEASYGEMVYGNAVQVDISMDKIRALPDNYQGEDLGEHARIEVSRVPIETGRLTFRELTTPGLFVNPDPDPDLRCNDPAVARLVERFM